MTILTPNALFATFPTVSVKKYGCWSS